MGSSILINCAPVPFPFPFPIEIEIVIAARRVPSLAGQILHLAGQILHFAGQLPHLAGRIPSVASQILHIPGQIPHIPGQIPHFPRQILHIPGRIPSVASQILHIPGQILHIPGQIPHFTLPNMDCGGIAAAPLSTRRLRPVSPLRDGDLIQVPLEAGEDPADVLGAAQVVQRVLEGVVVLQEQQRRLGVAVSPSWTAGFPSCSREPNQILNHGALCLIFRVS